MIATARSVDAAATNSLLEQHLGDAQISPENIELLQDALLATGAVDQVEAQIQLLTEQALAALESPQIEPSAREALTQLAIMATQRNS